MMCTYTNNVETGCQQTWTMILWQQIHQYLNVSGYGDYCSDGLTSWSVYYSLEKWMTLTNYDGIKYVYQITPRIYPYIPSTATNCDGFGPEKTSYSTSASWLSGKHGWLSLHRPLGFEFIRYYAAR